MAASSKQAKQKNTGIVDDFAKVMKHHRAAWRVERVAWALMAVLLLAALFGAFGDGLLSRAQAGSSQTVQLKYDRLLRSSAPAEYRFEINPALADAGVLRLRIDESLMEKIEPESIVPEPEEQQGGPGYTEFAFRAGAGPAPVRITFRYRPSTFGRFSGRISIGGAQPLMIDHFVYP